MPSLSLADVVTAIVAGDVNAAPSAGLVIEIDGGTFAATVTCTSLEVVVAPSLSVATAVSVYEPAATLLHVTLYGLVVSVPIGWPFAKKSTDVTVPPLSPAVALIVMSPAS